MAGFDPSRIEVLSLGYVRPAVECTKPRWWEIFKAYAVSARCHAANLAAHNWDVLLIGERVFLYQPRYGGEFGHWLGLDGSREDATAAQMKALYGNKRLPDGSRSRRFCDSDRSADVQTPSDQPS